MNPLYAALIPPQGRCIDIGASLGSKTAAMLDAGAGFVLAVEPMPETAEALRRYFSYERRVQVLQVAIGPRRGTAELHVCSASPTLCTLSRHFRQSSRFARHQYVWDRTIRVQQVNISQLLGSGLWDFVKVDVEGYEYEILSGLRRNVGCLCFEYHEEFLDRAELCLAKLYRVGFRQFAFTRAEQQRLASDWQNAGDTYKCLRRRQPAADESWGYWGDVYARP